MWKSKAEMSLRMPVWLIPRCNYGDLVNKFFLFLPKQVFQGYYCTLKAFICVNKNFLTWPNSVCWYGMYYIIKLSRGLVIKSGKIKVVDKSKPINTTIKFNSFCQEFYDLTPFFRIELSPQLA